MPDLTGATPPTFEHYCRKVNEFELLGLLRDHWLHRPIGDPDPRAHQDHALRELAMAAAVVATWSGWLAIDVHRALLNGADLGDVAAAMGRTAPEVFEVWLPWVEGQVGLWHTSVQPGSGYEWPIGVSPEQRDLVLARFGSV